MEDNNFLICGNCVNWGQPWRLRKQVILCEKRKDITGSYYTSQHAACKYFSPITPLPFDLQKIRLFIQELTPDQYAYFAWALSQASIFLKCKDAKGKHITLGDQVSFTLGKCLHTGTVEGVDMKFKNAILINSPSLANNMISLLPTMVTKISKLDALDILNKDDGWQISCLKREIALLRCKPSLTADEKRSLLLYEAQLDN